MAHSPTTPDLAQRGWRVAAALLLALPVAAQGASDQVSYRDTTGRARTWHGEVTENTLEKTVIEVRGRTRTVDSAAVDLVVFGKVPGSYQEAQSYFDRKDFENAAARFRVAASDTTARDVVRADARLKAGEAELLGAAGDAAGYGRAVEQFDTFLSEFPEDRAVPRARSLRARALWLGGDPTAAASAYRELYEAGLGASPMTGYPQLLCARAGESAARCLLSSGDAAGASSLFQEVSTTLTTLLAGLDDAAPGRFELTEVLAEARLGEGFCLLAQGSAAQARTFFQGQLSGAPRIGAQRYGAHLGLGEALLADGRAREAELEFAQVSALEPANRDRIARALLGLAGCAAQLSDDKAAEQRKLWLETLTDQYGDTPSALRAQELLKSL